MSHPQQNARRRVRVFVVCAVALAGIAAVASLVVSAPDRDRIFRADARVVRGFEIAPVPLDLKGKSPAQVGLGSYLVNAAGGCNDCHTCPPYQPGTDPFAGDPVVVNSANYLAGGTPFGPALVSPNLTPDPENGLPAGLTLQEFMTAIRTGHDPDNPEEILQVMPWPVYRNLVDQDLKAIYEFLRAIPHAESGCVAGTEAPARR